MAHTSIHQYITIFSTPLFSSHLLSSLLSCYASTTPLFFHTHLHTPLYSSHKNAFLKSQIFYKKLASGSTTQVQMLLYDLGNGLPYDSDMVCIDFAHGSATAITITIIHSPFRVGLAAVGLVRAAPHPSLPLRGGKGVAHTSNASIHQIHQSITLFSTPPLFSLSSHLSCYSFIFSSSHLFFPHTSQPPMYKTHLSSSHTPLHPHTTCTKNVF